MPPYYLEYLRVQLILLLDQSTLSKLTQSEIIGERLAVACVRLVLVESYLMNTNPIQAPGNVLLPLKVSVILDNDI